MTNFWGEGYFIKIHATFQSLYLRAIHTPWYHIVKIERILEKKKLRFVEDVDNLHLARLIVKLKAQSTRNPDRTVYLAQSVII